ncbi:hypothetical protein KCV06_g120, partial [Aureobasidium melanogenum]
METPVRADSFLAGVSHVGGSSRRIVLTSIMNCYWQSRPSRVIHRLGRVMLEKTTPTTVFAFLTAVSLQWYK